jgi:hypothetical protein
MVVFPTPPLGLHTVNIREEMAGDFCSASFFGMVVANVSLRLSSCKMSTVSRAVSTPPTQIWVEAADVSQVRVLLMRFSSSFGIGPLPGNPIGSGAIGVGWSICQEEGFTGKTWQAASTAIPHD